MARTDDTYDLQRILWAYLESLPWTRCPVFASDVPYDVKAAASVAAHSFKTPDHTPQEVASDTGFVVILQPDETGRTSEGLLSGTMDLGAGDVRAQIEWTFFTVSFSIVTPANLDGRLWRGHAEALEEVFRGRTLQPTGDDSVSWFNRPTSGLGPRFRQRATDLDLDPWRQNFLDAFFTRHRAVQLHSDAVTEVTI